LAPSQFEIGFVSLAHTEQDIEQTLRVACGSGEDAMKIVVAMTGASGAIYTPEAGSIISIRENHEIHFISTKHAREVGQIELPKGELKIAPSVIQYDENGSMFVPFVSGSPNWMRWCRPRRWARSGGSPTGVSDRRLRGGDVFLKERRKLIFVPREAPYNLIHLRNMATLTEAGAMIIPASPSFTPGRRRL